MSTLNINLNLKIGNSNNVWVNSQEPGYETDFFTDVIKMFETINCKFKMFKFAQAVAHLP